MSLDVKKRKKKDKDFIFTIVLDFLNLFFILFYFKESLFYVYRMVQNSASRNLEEIGNNDINHSWIEMPGFNPLLQPYLQAL